MMIKQDNHEEEKKILKESITALYTIQDNLSRTMAKITPTVFEDAIKCLYYRLGVLEARE